MGVTAKSQKTAVYIWATVLLKEKQKANQTDIPEETVGFEQEDVYVDMVECAETAQQQSSTDLCSNETDMDPVTEAKQYLQKYVVVDNKNEYVEEEINGSDKMLNLTDYHCLLIPDANSSRPFENENPSVLDETGNTNKEEEWFQHSPEDKSDWQNIKCDHNMIYPHENMYVPMPVHSIAKDLPSNDYHECLTASLLPKHNLSVQHDCFQEEDINKENMSQGACDECPEEHVLNEHDEEPVLIASTLDDVYIIFENSIKDTQRGQKPLISHNMSTPVASSTPTIASGTSYISQEKRVDDNQNVSHGELDEYSDKGSDHENEEDPLLVASTGDDLYLVFENSVKKKPRGPTSFILHSLEPPEAAANSITEGGASYIAQDQGHDERFDTQLLWEEYEDNEDPYSLIYNEDDELYIELPYETEESTRERKSFIVHRAPAPAPRPENTAPQMEDSYISRVFRQKEEEKKIYSAGLYQDRMHLAKQEPQVPAQQYALSGQDELILLQEKVKMGIITMDEALQKFQQWKNEKSALDLLQQKKLQELRDNIIGDKTDDDKVYDKITIVHQPNAFPGKKRTTYGMFDNSIYQKTNKSAVLADKRDDIVKNPKKKFQ